MVSVVVLDEEVHVQAWHVEELAHETLHQRLAVAKFMGDVDAVGGQQDASGQGKPDHLEALVAPRLHLKQSICENAEDNGHVQVQHCIENPLGFLVGGLIGFEVVRGLPRNQVEEGDDDEGVKYGGVCPEAMRGKGHKHGQRHRVGKEVFQVFQNLSI